MARSKLSVVTASSEESNSYDGLDTENLAGAKDPPPPKKKTKVDVVADAVPSAATGLDEYDCETDEDTDDPTVSIDEMREQLKELTRYWQRQWQWCKKQLEEKDAIISQLNERISDLEQDTIAIKKDDIETDAIISQSNERISDLEQDTITIKKDDIEKDAIISQSNERISDLEQDTITIKKDDIDADNDVEYVVDNRWFRHYRLPSSGRSSAQIENSKIMQHIL
jgi:vacuolar-type H+-ATPase subunit I/STV1